MKKFYLLYLIICIVFLSSSCNKPTISNNTNSFEINKNNLSNEVVSEKNTRTILNKQDATDTDISTKEVIVNMVEEAGYFTNNFGEKTGEYSYCIPKINLSSDGAKSINNSIYDKFYPLITEYSDAYEIKYDIIKNDNILSLIVQAKFLWEYTDYEAYNINIKTGEKIENKDLICMYGYNEDTFTPLLKSITGNYYLERYKERSQDEYFNEYYEYTTSDKLCNLSIPMYIGNNNKLHIVANIGSLAGASSYEHIIDTGLSLRQTTN